MLADPSPQPVESLYVHVPFCAHKCAYCAFYSEASSGELINRYVEALVRELEIVAPGLRPRTKSEEHTSELQSQSNLVCRLLLEKKKKMKQTNRKSTTLNSSKRQISYAVIRFKKTEDHERTRRQTKRRAQPKCRATLREEHTLRT